MDSKTARQEWDRAFQGEINFVDARNSKIKLDNYQIDKLYNVSRELRYTELKKIYRETWGKMRADDRIVTESAYYNCPSLVGSKTKYKYKYYMVKYYQTGNLEYKKVAQKELSEKSNRGNNRGLSMRRNHEVRISRGNSHRLFVLCPQPNLFIRKIKSIE